VAPDRKEYNPKIKLKIWPHGILLVLVLGVISLSLLAFIHPVAHGAAQVAPTQTPLATAAEGLATQSTDQNEAQETLSPPTPDEIGSTNGIIFWSTVLILILLVGTLRETIHRKGQ
jgi:hypothetical protein